MSNYWNKVERNANLKNKRRKRREELVGEEGRVKQDSRDFNSRVKGALSKGDSVAKARTREVQKRMSEYKSGKFKGFSKGGKTR